MGRIFQRRKGGSYWGDWIDPTTSKRHQRSLQTRDRKVAVERLREAELAATPQARGRKERLSQAIDLMIAGMHDKAEATREMYREKGRRIITTMGDPYVHEIDRDMVSKYIAVRLSDDKVHGKAGAHTVSKELITIRRALREAHERGVIHAMPAMPRHSPKYKPRETWLTPKEMAALMTELEPKRRLWVALAALAGGSAGEVERCAWETTNLIEGFLRMPGTKRETRDRWVPIGDALYALLDEVPPAKRHGLLVERWVSVRRDLHRACDRAGVKRVSPNDLRRTFASWLVQSGTDLYRVAQLMGHASTRMVEKVYGKLSRENLAAAIAGVAAFRRVTPVPLNQARSRLLPPTRDPSDEDPEF